MPPINYVINDARWVISENIYTTEGKIVALSHNWDDRDPKHEEEIVKKHPQVFGLLDGEILYVRRSAQSKVSLEILKEAEWGHRLQAIELIDQKTKMHIVDPVGRTHYDNGITSLAYDSGGYEPFEVEELLLS